MPKSFRESGRRGFITFWNLSQCFYSSPLFTNIVIPLEATVHRDTGSTSASSLHLSFFIAPLLQEHPGNAQRIRTKRVCYSLKSLTMLLFVSTLRSHSHSPGSYSAEDIQGIPRESGQRGFVTFSNITWCFYSFPLFTHTANPLEDMQTDRGLTSVSSLQFTFFIASFVGTSRECPSNLENHDKEGLYYLALFLLT